MNQSTTSYAITVQGEHVVVTLMSEDCAGLWVALQPVVAGEPAARGVILDFAKVEFIDSVNIAAVIAVRNQMEATGRRFAVANLRPAIRAVFTVLKLDRMFPITLDLSQAQAHVTAG